MFIDINYKTQFIKVVSSKIFRYEGIRLRPTKNYDCDITFTTSFCIIERFLQYLLLKLLKWVYRYERFSNRNNLCIRWVHRYIGKLVKIKEKRFFIKNHNYLKTLWYRVIGLVATGTQSLMPKNDENHKVKVFNWITVKHAIFRCKIWRTQSIKEFPETISSLPRCWVALIRSNQFPINFLIPFYRRLNFVYRSCCRKIIVGSNLYVKNVIRQNLVNFLLDIRVGINM